MVLKLITDQEIWDTFIEQNHTSTLMHNWNFLKTIEKHSNYKLLTYGIYKNDELICIIPLFLKQIYFIKLLFSPPPMTGLPYLGFIYKDLFFNLRSDQKETFLKYIFIELNKEINKIKPNYLTITSIPNLIDFRFFKWNKYKVDVKYTYLLDLSKSIELIFSNIKDKKRQKINRAKKEDIEISELNDSEIVFNYLKVKYNEQKMTLPIISKEYLNELKNIYPNNIIFRIAKFNGQIIGSEALMNYNDLHLNWLGSSKTENKIPINELLIWDYIERAKKIKLNKFDFVGANNEHISFFKSQFGPELAPYYTIKKADLIGELMEKIYLRFIKRTII